MKSRSKSLLVALMALLLCSDAFSQNANEAESAAQQLHTLLDEYAAWEAEHFPSVAFSRGDQSKAGLLDDHSLAAIERNHEAQQRFLSALSKIDHTQLSTLDTVSYDIFRMQRAQSVAGHAYRDFLIPVGGWFGPEQVIPTLHVGAPFRDAQDFRDYISRLQQVPVWVDQLIERMEKGIEEGILPTRLVIEVVPKQLKAALNGDGLRQLASPFRSMPSVIPNDEKELLKTSFEDEAYPLVESALQQLLAYVETTYLPACRDEIGVMHMRNGASYYDHQLWVMTTLHITAKEVFETGHNEMERIRKEMVQVIGRTDYFELHPDARTLDDDALLDAFLNYLRTDERFYYDNPEDLIAGYESICKRIDRLMPQFFNTLPRTPYGVEAIPSFMAPNKTTAYYSHGNLEQGRAGTFFANTYALRQRPRYEMRALTVHEAVPGHHHQVAIQQELEDLPEFRRNAWFTAHGEGWALYCERLGIEMGLYEDPYDDFGRLVYEAWRACRLVVDPGIHAFGWSRDEAIEYMKRNTALSELNIANEVDRYIAWPGQATGYKIGEITIRKLRQHAEEELGESFDLRAFHDVLLLQGSVPLGVLTTLVHEWINEIKHGGRSTS